MNIIIFNINNNNIVINNICVIFDVNIVFFGILVLILSKVLLHRHQVKFVVPLNEKMSWILI